MNEEQRSAQIIRDVMGITRRLADEHRVRFGRHADVFVDGKLALPNPELLEGCRLVESRAAMLARMPRDGDVAEVGTLYGDWAVQMLETLKPKSFKIFDLGWNNLKPENQKRLDDFGVSWCKGCSWEMLAAEPAESLDLIYIDADHTYDAVSKDLAEALRVVRPGGYILCNDYCSWSNLQFIPYGVFGAVNIFANAHGLPFEYFSLQLNGYYDVAVRKPI